MVNRTCPIGYSGDCSSCDHWQDNECCHKDALCPRCGAHMENWQQMMGEVHYCPTPKEIALEQAYREAAKRALIEIESDNLNPWQELQDKVNEALNLKGKVTEILSGECKAKNLPQAMLDSALGDWYDKGYRLTMGEDLVTLYYAGYDDVVFVFGRKVPGIIPAIKQACYLHALKKRGRANG